MSQPQTKSSTPSSPTYGIVERVIKHFNKKLEQNPKNVHLNDDDLHQLGFKRTGIDYQTGRPDDGGPQVIKLKPFQQITFNPDDVEKCIESISGIQENTNFDTAHMVAEELLYLFDTLDKDRPYGAALKSSPWVLKENPEGGFEFSRNFFVTSVCDAEKVDLVCFNAIEDDLQNDTVSPYELHTACRWVDNRLRQPEYNSLQKISSRAGIARSRNFAIITLRRSPSVCGRRISSR
ncbi:hypothetical protein F4810DRAFT_450065 [Camillea tinctor]|nr:hypothetical protein F4810DRAFT_450065 [Camillea tinctor]